MKKVFFAVFVLLNVLSFRANAQIEIAMPGLEPEASIQNFSSWDLVGIQMRVPDYSDWGINLIEGDTLHRPAAYFFRTDCYTYDFKMTNTLGQECIINGVELCADTGSGLFEFIEADLKRCADE